MDRRPSDILPCRRSSSWGGGQGRRVSICIDSRPLGFFPLGSSLGSSARIELDAALMRVVGPLLKNDTEFYKQFVQNDSFRRFVTEMVVQLTGD